MERYNISESEWKVMQCLWQEDALTLREIVDRLKNTDWSYTTIRTMVTRLMDKGMIDADRSSPSSFRYFAIVPEDECKVKEAESFLTRVFDGSISLMISTLTKQETLSDDEIAELKRIIDSIDGSES